MTAEYVMDFIDGSQCYLTEDEFSQLEILLFATRDEPDGRFALPGWFMPHDGKWVNLSLVKTVRPVR